jgi:hypothetical protein
MGDTQRVVDGEDRPPVRPLRPAAPPDGPLAGSGAATDPVAVPRPRRPWLRSTGADASAPTTDPGPPDGPTSASTSETTTPDPASGGPESDPTATPAPPLAAPEPTTGTSGKAADRAGETGDQPDQATDPAGKAAGEPGEAADGAVRAGEAAGEAGKAAVARRRRVPFAHAVRLPPPRQAVVAAARATRAWSRRPSGRLTLPGVFLLALVAVTATAGALLVPATLGAPHRVAVDAGASGPATALPEGGVPGPAGGTALPGFPGLTPPPGGVLPTGPVVGPIATGRPADALGDWARQTGARVGISPVAMQAYGYAELALAQTNRSCQLSWTTLAAIGYVESRHGQANGARLSPDGRAEPEIIGDPLDGQGGRSKIMDTDRGLFDRDSTYDRAIGPMQFIPSTWQLVGADADNDGRRDPHDLDDASLAAGNYLCQGGRNMTIPGDWWGAILSYNDVRRYAQDVFDKANEYGVASRT